MKLTREDAIRIAVELWTWLAGTGADDKMDWDGWEKYGRMNSDCPLCEYSVEEEGKKFTADICNHCPYYQKFRLCYAYDKPFDRWGTVVTTKSKKKYAALFLEQLKQL